MDLAQTTTSFVTDSQAWLASAHGTRETDTVTLDITLFTTLLAGAFNGGFIPSGLVLGIVTATGKYGPYNDTALDGRQVARGHLFHAVRAKTGDTNDKVGAMLWHGEVVEANLPASAGLDAAGKVDMPLMKYV